MNIKTHFRFVVCCCLLPLMTLTGCGGGSSGTGDETTNAQLLSANCSPLSNQNLADLGLASVEGTTNQDGGFTLSPDVAGSLQINSVVASDAGPACLLVILRDAEPFTILSFPQDQLESCAVADVRNRYPGEVESFCRSS